jgi:hypothetical protein
LEAAMQWFKHMTDASTNDFIARLEARFEFNGYARWFKLLEIVGQRVDANDRCEASHPISRWQILLKAKKKTLFSFVEYVEKEGRISTERDGNILKISIPNLLKYRDEYTKRSARTTGRIRKENRESTNVRPFHFSNGRPKRVVV